MFGLAHAILVFSALSGNKGSPEPMLLVYTMYVDKDRLIFNWKTLAQFENQASDVCKE